MQMCGCIIILAPSQHHCSPLPNGWARLRAPCVEPAATVARPTKSYEALPQANASFVFCVNGLVAKRAGILKQQHSPGYAGSRR
jgi:hypothetical protein